MHIFVTHITAKILHTSASSTYSISARYFILRCRTLDSVCQHHVEKNEAFTIFVFLAGTWQTAIHACRSKVYLSCLKGKEVYRCTQPVRS